MVFNVSGNENFNWQGASTFLVAAEFPIGNFTRNVHALRPLRARVVKETGHSGAGAAVVNNGWYLPCAAAFQADYNKVAHCQC